MDPPEKMDCKANGEVILGVHGPSQPHLRENLLPAINRPLCARSSEACCLFMPRLTVAHVMDQEAHTLIVCRVEPEHAGKNLIGFFEPAEPPQTETIAI
jgi:hypothetical protein